MSRSPWSLEEALALIRMLEPKLTQVGFHVALMGSVLIEGHSTNDLDLILFPHSSNRVDVESARLELTIAGLRPVISRARVAAAWEREGSSDAKHVEVWAYNDKRVDLFFMR